MTQLQKRLSLSREHYLLSQSGVSTPFLFIRTFSKVTLRLCLAKCLRTGQEMASYDNTYEVEELGSAGLAARAVLPWWRGS